jgi:outer membrane protein assembly factor BamB
MRALPLIVVLLSAPLSAQSWSQWGAGPRHTGSLPVVAQHLGAQHAAIVVDPFVPQERAETGGSLLVHYQTPLSDGNEVFMAMKGGTYAAFSTWETQTWSVRKFAWVKGELVAQWTALSDWDPPPSGGFRFEPVFHSALTERFVYMPGAGGTVLEVDRESGAITRRLGTFGVIDPNLYVTSPIVIDETGNLYYNTLRVAVTNPWTTDHLGAWLVKITPAGIASRASYTALVPGAPAANGPCTNAFPSSNEPSPPSPGAVAPAVLCGSQRAGINIAPAVGTDGTIYTVSRTHLPASTSRWAWLVAVNPDLTPKWATSLRNRFNDGCNVLLPPNGTPGGCRTGTTTGVDPSDNQPGSGHVNDNSTSSPVVAPDGTIYYGSYTRYNFSQGHMMRFSATGEFLSAYKFGWDVTPAIWEHEGTFSLITKENRYVGQGIRVPGDEEGYYITQLSPELNVEWQFKGTNTLSCSRRTDGSLQCTDDRPEGFEWCVNALAVDSRGVVYVNSEDGHLYAINQGGVLRERIFLQLTLGAAYTPLSLGADGRIYTQNAGILFAVGSNTKKRRAVRP